ncbi:MAG: Glu/Leu/Phe/Val dehydrogenase [Myxococcales bacterium]|jgi:leucine dehydrogenase|nr:Glu/Leu/Phe/Val dehydrogenase [Myxococcales bacterium]
MIFQILTDLEYGQLHMALDRATGLRAIVALHSTRLGPAIGGCRVYPYVDETAAVTDACRLARAMGYKAALARLPHGGGKAVIWATEAMRRPDFDRAALFTAFARFVDSLGGAYLTCEDSGTSTRDMDVVRKTTKHVLGFSTADGGSGDPSPFTALGCRRGIEAVCEVILGRKDGKDMAGLHVAIQGVGAVGRYLALELHKLGARLTIADIDPGRAERVAAETGAKIISIEEIFDVECDIFAPCALGGAISPSTLPRLRCRAVAGAANNQLASPTVGRTLQERGIFYAPDYAINAGGLINVAQEFAGYDAEKARERASGIYATIREIAERTQQTGRPPGEIADQLAEEIIAAGPQALAT